MNVTQAVSSYPGSFRGRRIGALKEGYEASFVALEGDPLEDWANVRRIRTRFKQGVVLTN